MAEDLEGADVIRWLEQADRTMAPALVGAVFSDANSEWRVIGVAPQTLQISIEPFGGGLVRYWHYNRFRIGTFSFGDDQVLRLIKGNPAIQRSENESLERVLNRCLREHGVGRPELLSQDLRQRLGHSVRDMANQLGGEADRSDWRPILHGLGAVTPENRGGVLSVLLKMLHNAELRSGNKEVYYRTCIADTCRKAWNFPEEALKLTDVLALPRERLAGTNVSIAFLCRTRAWLFVERAKNTFDMDVRSELRSEAQKLYQRAYGLLQNSDHVGDRDLSVLKGQIDQLM